MILHVLIITMILPDKKKNASKKESAIRMPSSLQSITASMQTAMLIKMKMYTWSPTTTTTTTMKMMDTNRGPKGIGACYYLF
jgi:hypothetical protein